ncbi:MAG: hypothetical protein AAF670_01685 [Planctomycetota bacterium]
MVELQCLTDLLIRNWPGTAGPIQIVATCGATIAIRSWATMRLVAMC